MRCLVNNQFISDAPDPDQPNLWSPCGNTKSCLPIGQNSAYNYPSKDVCDAAQAWNSGNNCYDSGKKCGDPDMCSQVYNSPCGVVCSSTPSSQSRVNLNPREAYSRFGQAWGNKETYHC
jgi:hypothetical protein